MEKDPDNGKCLRELQNRWCLNANKAMQFHQVQKEKCIFWEEKGWRGWRFRRRWGRYRARYWRRRWAHKLAQLHWSRGPSCSRWSTMNPTAKSLNLRSKLKSLKIFLATDYGPGEWVYCELHSVLWYYLDGKYPLTILVPLRAHWKKKERPAQILEHFWKWKEDSVDRVMLFTKGQSVDKGLSAR